MPAPRQTQSRLSFTPLPSSSPAAKDYPRQMQERAAAVTIRGSPAKMRKLRDREQDVDGMPPLDGASDSMPTPAATSERTGNSIHRTDIPGDDEASDDIPLVPTARLSSQQKFTSRKSARQRQLDFSNTRDTDSFDSPVTLASSARPQSSHRPGIFNSQRRRATVVSSDDESEDELPASPAKYMARGLHRRSKRGNKPAVESERVTRNTRRSSHIEPEMEEDNITVSSHRRQLPLEAGSEDDKDDMPTTAAAQRRKRARKEISPDSFISSSPPLGPIDSDDDLEILEHSPKKRKRHQHSVSGLEEDDKDEDAGPVTPGRRKLKRPRKVNQQEAEDLADDLDFLGPSSDVETSARKPRNTQTAQKEARQSALEKLKRKRSNQPTQSEPVIVEDDEEELDDGEDGDELYGEGEEEEVEDDARPPMSSRQYFAVNEQDEGFIESDGEAGGEDGILGLPDPTIPIEFTRYARMKPKELFPFAVEWMVQKKINPAFSMDDEVYGLTFRKLDDEVTGLKNSKFKSAAWTQQFKFALEARPEIAYEPLDRTGEHYMNDHCDACNRNSHPATFQIQFQGKPYHVQTLEDVASNDDDDDEDSNSESDSDQADENSKSVWDAQGRVIVPATYIFYVGKFCMANAQTAHSLEHWRYHLNEYVVTWLTRNGCLAPEKIVKRDSWNEKKRRKNANKIADRMGEEGVVKQLWEEFRGNINEARSSKYDRGGRW